MRSSHSRLAITIIAGLVVGACTSAVTPAPSSAPPSTAAPSPTVPAVTASPSPTATPPAPDPTPDPLPPKPTGVTFEQEVHVDDVGVGRITQTVTWQAPLSAGVEIRVDGVIECISEPADPGPGTHGPCLVVRTPLPASLRTRLATASASDGVVSWTWTHVMADCGEPELLYDPGGPAYHAVVLAAYGAAGHSIFAIAEPGGWWRADLNEITC